MKLYFDSNQKSGGGKRDRN